MRQEILPGTPETADIAKAQAKRLSKALEGRLPLKHGQALEVIARTHGQETWGHLCASLALAPQRAGESVILGGETLNHACARIRSVVPSGPSSSMLMDVMTEVLIRALAPVDGPDVIPEMTESALRARIGAVKAPDHLARSAWGVATEALIDALHRAPRREFPLESAMSLTSARRAFGLLAEETPIERDEALFNGKHSAVFGPNIEPLRAAAESRGLDFHDISGRDWDLSGLEERMGIPASPVRLVDPLDALRRVCWSHKTGSRPAKRQVVVVGLPRRATGVDVMFAQTRSMGLHLCVRADRELVAGMDAAVATDSWVLLDQGIVLRNW